MKTIKLAIVFYFGLSGVVLGQTGNCFNKALRYCQNGQMDSSLLYFNPCTIVLSDSIQAVQMFELGNCYYYSNYEQAAMKCYSQLLAKGVIGSNWTGKDSSVLYKKIGNCYYFLSKYKLAVNAFDLGVNFEKKKSIPNYTQIVQLLIQKSNCFIYTNDYEKAESVLEKGLTYCLQFPDELESEYGSILIRLASVFTWKDDCRKAIIYAKQFEEYFFRQKNNSKNDIQVALNKLGEVYMRCGKFEEAYKFYQRTIPYYNKKTITQIDFAYSYMGDCQFYMKNYSKAIALYLKSYAYLEETNRHKIDTKIDLHSRLGACYTNCNEYEKATKHFDEVLHLLDFSEDKKNLFYLTEDKKNLLTHLYFKAKNHLKSYDESHAIEDLQEAHEWYDICIQLIDNIFEGISLNSQQYFLDNSYYIFESIIETNYQLYLKTGEEKYISAALFYAEKSRSILLKESMHEASAKILSGVPDSVFVYEEGLKSKQAELENTIFTDEQSLDKQVVLKLKMEVADLKQKRQAQNELIKKRYPDYARLRNQKDTLSIEDVRSQLLRPDETLLHYFVGDDCIYILTINATEANMVKQKKESSFESSIHDLRTSIYNYAITEADSSLVKYRKNAFALYELLIQPLDLPTDLDVLIVPDGLLEYVPFDALLKEKTTSTDFTSLPFLVLDYNIRYLHSGLLGIQKKENIEVVKHRKVLAIAPTFTGGIQQNRSFAALKNNISEVNNIKQYFAVNILEGEEAQLPVFKEIATEYACLHLATHAIADNENGERSFLAFSPTKDTAVASVLYARDISLMDLHADMVVLSACETAVGNLRRGEGIISLARAFSYAGAESLITTLWRVSDDESEIFMDKFYEGLQQGQPKNEALRNAKLHFIQNETPRRAQPFFWAAYIPLGEMNPIVLDGKSNFLSNGTWLLLLFSTLLIVFFYYKNKNANTHRN